MNRRRFFKNGSLVALGSALINPFQSTAETLDFSSTFKNKKAKNIIFLVSDGMSSGTLNMADLYLNRTYGKGSNWLQLYTDNKVTRALMDTASANSIVTDSAAGSSAWGGGVRVPNGSLNVSASGENFLPIWQKFKKAGKKAGCVTTVPITHATPAGFCVNTASRNSQQEIAEMYLQLGFDVLMGGGNAYFSATKRKDQKDLYAAYAAKGYQVVQEKAGLENCTNAKPILGIFDQDALPYYVDRNQDAALQQKIPTLAEMAQKAIDNMKDHAAGFVLQIESGKVDWAAHANDIAGLLHEQIQFDEAIKVAMDFAEKNQDTLVIITTDHGNANPGVIYGKEANAQFDSIQKYTQSNEWILNAIHADFSTSGIRELVEKANGTVLTEENAKLLLDFYTGLEKEDDGLYNFKKLPFKSFAEMQKKTNAVGWISMDHSADYVELAAYGPGSHLLRSFVKNTDLHNLMLAAAEVENKF